MKKRILATILCICLLVPCFACLAFAADGDKSPWDVEIVNVAPKGKTYQSSIWNQDSPARYINNGQYYSSWQFWRPGDEQRGAGFEGIDNTRQWCGLSFNYYQTINSVTLYTDKYGDFNGAYCGDCDKRLYEGQFRINYKLDDNGNPTTSIESRTCLTCMQSAHVYAVSDQNNNAKYTIEVLIQGQWYVAGHGYNDDATYVINKDGSISGDANSELTIKFDKVFPQYDKNGDIIVDENGEPVLTDFATTKNVRVVCSEYGAWAFKGVSNEISFTYDADGEITHVNYKGRNWAVTRDAADTANRAYVSNELYEITTVPGGNHPIKFVIREDVGGSMFDVVYVEYQEVVRHDNENKDPVMNEDGSVRTKTIVDNRYFFEYDEAGKVIIGQKTASTHDWWLIPIVQEVELWGHQAVTIPKFDVPEGAEVVTDAALGGMASATTSANMCYPLLGNDRTKTTQWVARDYENQSYWIDFDKDYQIKDIVINFGNMPADRAGSEYTYNLYVKKDGAWTLLKGNNTVVTDSQDVLDTYDVEDKIGGFKVEFTSSKKDGANIVPAITDTNATISNGEQCVFLSGYLNTYRASSIAQGNLAPYGTAYCSSSFDYSNISDVNFINDGQTTDDAFSWYAENFARGNYCGITLKDSEDVTKVTLYFNDVIVQGKPQDHVMTFDVQVLVDGEYKTVKSGTSYDSATKSSIITVVFDAPVRTNDVRIVYQANGLVFPYLKELEIYAGEKLYSAFDGYQLDPTVRTLHGRAATTTFAPKTIVKRASFMNEIAPLEFLVFAAKYNIQ
jgi:hypothetical protein